MESIAILLQEVSEARERIERKAWAYQANQLLDDVEYWLKQAGDDGGTWVDPAEFRDAVAEAEQVAVKGPKPRRVLGKVPLEALQA